MGDCNKVSSTCGDTTFAGCAVFEGTTNNASKIKENCKKSVENTTQDIYNQLGELTNLAQLGQSCLTYDKTADNRTIVANVLLKIEQEVCTLKNKVQALETVALCNKSVVGCNFDFGTLTNQCETQPQTFKEVIQLILDNLNP
jgi:hypothetical protein